MTWGKELFVVIFLAYTSENFSQCKLEMSILACSWLRVIPLFLSFLALFYTIRTHLFLCNVRTLFFSSGP